MHCVFTGILSLSFSKIFNRVEFQSKFFMYGGLKFAPFSFDETLVVHCEIPSD